MLRSLTHFGRINLALLASTAVVTAVLTGALLVGDSLRGSLRSLALDRLGRIDEALVAERFFREGLGENVGGVPAILLSGSAAHGKTGARVSGLQVQGVPPAFATLFPHPHGGAHLSVLTAASGPFPPAVVNAAVAAELGVAVGETILLSVRRPSPINRAYVLGSREPAALLTTLRYTVAGIAPDAGLGRFGLQPHQLLPRNAFVPLASLQRELGLPGRVNALLRPTASGGTALEPHLALSDLGLAAPVAADIATVTSDAFVLRPEQVETVAATAAGLGLAYQPVIAYLANRIGVGDRGIPYSIVAGMDPTAGLGRLELVQGGRAPRLEADEILLNSWAAADLSAVVGDRVELAYFVVGPREGVEPRTVAFTLRGIVAITGLAAAAPLTPPFPGLHDAGDMASWSPPLPLDLSLVRARDEDYWDRYGALPKAFVSHATAARLWSTRFGTETAVRVLDPGRIFAGPFASAAAAVPGGMRFQPVRLRALEAAGGATDFGGLFIGFSLFLIAAAALLTAQLFRLGVERRAGEIGVMQALGYPVAVVRRRLIAEGLVVALGGGLVGTAGGLLYAATMLQGLGSWWLTAVGSRFLTLHAEVTTLAAGLLLSLLLVVLVIRADVRRVAGHPVRTLLGAGTRVVEAATRRARPPWLLAVGGTALGLVAGLLGLWHTQRATELFFATGALLLLAGLAAYAAYLRWGGRRKLTGAVSLGVGNGARKPGRSILVAGLVACACFVIVTVGANRRAEGGEDSWRPRTSGAGGYGLQVTADVPLHGDLNAAATRFDLGFAGADEKTLAPADIVPLRLVPGEDVSCLNLYQPSRPSLLGIPDVFITRGGFSFREHLGAAGDDPWQLLLRPLADGAIPAVGDYNSVRWIMHRQLGDDLVLEDAAGRAVRLRLVGLLESSLFQSELLVAEESLLHHFPSVAGYRRFLIDPGDVPVAAIAASLERTLGRFGLDATPTAAILERFRAIENTYLSTFETLGGLGLLLGTVGLGFVVLRHVAECRGELAMMRACGFSRHFLIAMLLAENGAALAVGLAVGLAAALVAVAPHLATPAQDAPIGVLAATLAAVLGVGLVVTAAAARWALRQDLIPALRTE